MKTDAPNMMLPDDPLAPLILSHLQNVAALETALVWEPFREGIEISRLYGDGRRGPAAAFLRYQPGASVPMHRHVGYEHVLVLSGSQRDQNGIYGAGTLVINPPDSRHAVVSDAGCVVLVIWEKPIVFETAQEEKPHG
jgi:anti-sigma factor ChrR (cupin superfamily)